MTVAPPGMYYSPDASVMRRCLELAAMGAGQVAPNPMVGAVLLHEKRIIGEGYHERYGGPHAEVNCIASVKPEDRDLISAATLYVSLEPCAHFGKTPPCADLIIREKVPRVVIGCRDPFAEVDGKGIGKLERAGVALHYPFLESECRELNRRFFTFHQQRRSYIILKWAESADFRISGAGGEPMAISAEGTNRLVHRWRSEEAGILVGTETALRDDPALTTRLWPGKNPTRLVLDLHARLPASLRIFDNQAPTIILTKQKEGYKDDNGRRLHILDEAGETELTRNIATAGHVLNLQSILVEGGRRLLQSFIDVGSWDEIRRISSRNLHAGEGVGAPLLNKTCALQETIELPGDVIRFYRNADQ